MKTYFFMSLIITLFLSSYVNASSETEEEIPPLGEWPVVSYGNSHLSGIYDSKEFDLKLSNGRYWKFTRAGKTLTKGKRKYACDVDRYGASWGDSTMFFHCKAKGKSSQEIYFYIFAFSDENLDKISGVILKGTNESELQMTQNRLSKDVYNGNIKYKSVQRYKFDLVRLKGWRK